MNVLSFVWWCRVQLSSRTDSDVSTAILVVFALTASSRLLVVAWQSLAVETLRSIQLIAWLYIALRQMIKRSLILSTVSGCLYWTLKSRQRWQLLNEAIRICQKRKAWNVFLFRNQLSRPFIHSYDSYLEGKLPNLIVPTTALREISDKRISKPLYLYLVSFLLFYIQIT